MAEGFAVVSSWFVGFGELQGLSRYVLDLVKLPDTLPWRGNFSDEERRQGQSCSMTH